MTQPLRAVYVWDLPVRLFHWSLVALVVLSWASRELDYMEVHRWSGYAILTLVAFRVGWGFRFTDDNFRYQLGNGDGGLGAELKFQRAIGCQRRDDSLRIAGRGQGGFDVALGSSVADGEHDAPAGRGQGQELGIMK